MLTDPLVPFSPEELAAADVVVVLVDHPEFDPAMIAEHARVGVRHQEPAEGPRVHR